MTDAIKRLPRNGNPPASVELHNLLNLLGLKPELEVERHDASVFPVAVVRAAVYHRLDGRSGAAIHTRVGEDVRVMEDAAYHRGIREGMLVCVGELIAADLLDVEGIEL